MLVIRLRNKVTLATTAYTPPPIKVLITLVAKTLDPLGRELKSTVAMDNDLAVQAVEQLNKNQTGSKPLVSIAAGPSTKMAPDTRVHRRHLDCDLGTDGTSEGFLSCAVRLQTTYLHAWTLRREH